MLQFKKCLHVKRKKNTKSDAVFYVKNFFMFFFHAFPKIRYLFRMEFSHREVRPVTRWVLVLFYDFYIHNSVYATTITHENKFK